MDGALSPEKVSQTNDVLEDILSVSRSSGFKADSIPVAL